ncbi:MAG: hypothetical protein LBD14_01050 [Puniceicoccales bacterium]|jgi:hypothetical protein|nr:hypothetical protein [Puniceicoccales bacterium]
MKKIVPGILTILIFPCATSAQADYKRVVSDEFVRGYISTQGTFASPEHDTHTGITGGVFTTPSALSGGDINQAFANTTAHYHWGWHTTKLGDVRPLLRISAAGAHYAGRARDENGLLNNSVKGATVSLGAGYGIHWRPWPNTTVSIRMNYAYLYTENDYTYANGSMKAGDGSTRNWFAHTISSTTELGVRQTLPLASDSWDGENAGKNIPCLILSTNITSLSMFGAYGKTRHQQRYASPFIITNGCELGLPLIINLGPALRTTLFVERTDILGDGRRSLTRDKCFYRAGLRLGTSHTNNAPQNWNDDIQLSASAIWGKGLNGCQIGIGLQF